MIAKSKEALIFNLNPTAVAGDACIHNNPLCTRHMPCFSPCHYPLLWWHSTFISSSWSHWLKALSQQQSAYINSRSNVLLYKLSLCALGRRKEKGRSWGFKVERHDHPLVPMSCELPQMKGRNWKSSRPHTPWLPAGSILYVFCNFRITSRYLCQGEGEQGEKERQVRHGALQHRKGRDNGEVFSFPSYIFCQGKTKDPQTRLSVINPGNLQDHKQKSFSLTSGTTGK